MIDGIIASIQAIRNDIEKSDGAALEARLSRARQSQEEWWKQRLMASWASESVPQVETPSASEMFGRLLGIGRKSKTNR